MMLVVLGAHLLVDFFLFGLLHLDVVAYLECFGQLVDRVLLGEVGIHQVRHVVVGEVVGMDVVGVELVCLGLGAQRIGAAAVELDIAQQLIDLRVYVMRRLGLRAVCHVGRPEWGLFVFFVESHALPLDEVNPAVEYVEYRSHEYHDCRGDEHPLADSHGISRAKAVEVLLFLRGHGRAPLRGPLEPSVTRGAGGIGQPLRLHPLRRFVFPRWLRLGSGCRLGPGLGLARGRRRGRAVLTLRRNQLLRCGHLVGIVVDMSEFAHVLPLRNLVIVSITPRTGQFPSSIYSFALQYSNHFAVLARLPMTMGQAGGRRYLFPDHWR